MDPLVRFAARYLLVAGGFGLVILGFVLNETIVTVAGFLLAFLGDALRRRGGLAAVAAWRTRWRTPQTPLMPAYLATPPDDLPPAVVGALVDSRVDREDIVATLVDLAQRGIVHIHPIGAAWRRGPTDFALTRLDTTTALAPFEARFLAALFYGLFKVGAQVRLSEVREPFAEARPTIVRLIEDEVARRGLTAPPPRSVINKVKVGLPLALLAIIAIWVGIGDLTGLAPAPWILGAALTAIGVLVWAVMELLPWKTSAGAEATANWEAFQRYLQTIDRFKALEVAEDLFERYLPYAIALGIEREWVRAFSRVATPAPSWYGNDGVAVVPGDTSGESQGWASPGNAGSWSTTDLQRFSDEAGMSLQALSNSLFDFFDAAGAAFSDDGGDGDGGDGDGGGDGGGGNGGGE